MRKKILIIGFAVVMALGLTACGSQVSYDDYDLSEYIKVGEYKGLQVAPYKISVTDDEVDTAIHDKLQDAATTQELDKKEAIEDGDIVNIDYVGKVNGKEFEGGTAQGYDLTIGSGSFIDGFESGLIGKKTGEKVELNLTFPDDYANEDLKGKDVVFSVTVNSVKRQNVPEYNLDFVKNTTKYTTLKDYEASVKKELEEQKTEEAINNQKMTLWSDLLEKTEVVKYPDRELDYYIQFNSDQIDEMAEEYGMTRDELLANYDFGDEDEFAAVNEDSSKLRVKQEMLIEYIAGKEGLKYSDEEKEKMRSDYEKAGYDDETVMKQTGQDMEGYLDMELLYQKVLDFLLENADITEDAKNK